MNKKEKITCNKSKPLQEFVETYNNNASATKKAIKMARDHFKKMNIHDINIYKSALICFEEIYLNIAYYAYRGKGLITIHYEFYPDFYRVSFSDSGKKFNPLKNKARQIAANERRKKAGGFGIMLVKNLVDEIDYNYKNKQNILTIRKNYK